MGNGLLKTLIFIGYRKISLFIYYGLAQQKDLRGLDKLGLFLEQCNPFRLGFLYINQFVEYLFFV